MSNLNQVAQSLHQGKYRSDLDGIRAIAVLLVIICHGFPNILPGGFIGVDIFFVISGFLITSILLNDCEKNKFSLKIFYKKRVKRIFPALIVVLLFTLLLGWYCLLNTEFHALGQHIIASTLFSENLLLWSQSSYFDTSSEFKPTLHLWSLAIEEQFYIFWPLLILAIYKFRLNFLYVLASVIFFSFAINVYDVKFNQTAAYYSPLGRSWELLVGAALAYIQIKKPFFLNNFKNFQSILGFLLIIIGLFLAKPNNFPGIIALFPTIGTFLLISAGPQAIINKNILSLSPLVWIGLISYPLYLWHWPFMSFSYIIFGKLPYIVASVCVIASLIAAYLTFILIEKLIRINGNKSVPYLALSMVSILILGLLISTHVLKGRLDSLVVPTSHEWRFLQSITPNFKSIKNSASYYPIFEERDKKTLFIGDSHVAQYSERINKYLSNHPEHGGALFVVGGNCIPIIGAYNVAVKEICTKHINNAYKIAYTDQFDTIVIGGAWNVALFNKNFIYNNAPMNAESTKNEVLNKLSSTIKDLESKGKKVILLLDNPNDPNLSLKSWKTRLNPIVLGIKPDLKVKVDDKHLKLNKELSQWAQKNKINYISPYENLCDDQSYCNLTDKNGVFIFKDNNHLNPDWVLKNAEYIDIIYEK